MKFKIKILKMTFLIFCTSFYQILLAQTSFSYSPGTSGSFNLSLPPINQNPYPLSPPPYYTLFVETGNGRYFKVPDPNSLFTNNINGTIFSNNTYTYPYHIAKGSNAVATISGWYDTTPRPPRNLSIIMGNPNGSPLQDQVKLGTGIKASHIGIDPCVTIIVPGDTMVTAITYKPYVGALSNNIVGLFYNNPSPSGLNNIFNTINGQTMYNFDNTVLDNHVQPTKAIRTHNNETVFSSIEELQNSIPGLPQSVIDKLNNESSGFLNKLYFVLPYIQPGSQALESNIFVSLAPTTNTNSYDTQTPSVFKAAIVEFNSGGVLNSNTKQVNLQTQFLARDPNKITSTPECLNTKDDVLYPWDILIKNRIEFHNEGPGDAKDIEVTVTVPDGIKFPTLLSTASLLVNGVPRLFTPNFGDNNYTLKPAQRKIVFKMNNIFLKGTVNQKNASKRVGYIFFDLKTNPFPQDIPQCMYTDISIVFINRNGTRNAPFVHAALIRRNCSIASPCSRFSPAGGPDTR